MCSLSWREPKQAKRPLVVNLDVAGPFKVLKPPLTLQPKETRQGGPEKSGPLAWWKLDEPSGATAANAAGPKLTGQLHGSPRWAPDKGRLKGALEFDGASTWLECPDGADLNLVNGFSAAIWVKARAAGKTPATLLAKGDAWQLQWLGTGNELAFTLVGPQTTGADKGKPVRVACKRPLDDNQWHHVAATYDGKKLILYVDGAEAGATAASGTVVLNNLPLTLGEASSSRGQLWNGWLDDARLYDRGLSADEVKALHRGS